MKRTIYNILKYSCDYCPLLSKNKTTTPSIEDIDVMGGIYEKGGSYILFLDFGPAMFKFDVCFDLNGWKCNLELGSAEESKGIAILPKMHTIISKETIDAFKDESKSDEEVELLIHQGVAKFTAMVADTWDLCASCRAYIYKLLQTYLIPNILDKIEDAVDKNQCTFCHLDALDGNNLETWGSDEDGMCRDYLDGYHLILDYIPNGDRIDGKVRLTQDSSDGPKTLFTGTGTIVTRESLDDIMFNPNRPSCYSRNDWKAFTQHIDFCFNDFFDNMTCSDYICEKCRKDLAWAFCSDPCNAHGERWIEDLERVVKEEIYNGNIYGEDEWGEEEE